VFYRCFFAVIAMLDIHVIWVRYGYFYYIAVVANLAYGFMAFVRRVTPDKRQGH